MAAVDGAYDCITKTPMGDQPSVFTVISSGGTFHGTNAGPLGSLDVKDGKVGAASFVNVESFVLHHRVPIEVEGVGVLRNPIADDA